MTVLEHMRNMFNVRARAQKAFHLPPLASLRGYELSDVPHDIVTGLLIAALSIPIAMGYAEIAGLAPVYGLYASILPAIVFALTTNTRSIVFGLDSAVTAVTGGVVVSAGVALGSEQAFELMPMLTLLVALFLLLFAFTRAGNLVHYVPEPVMNGFILGISITIIFRQIPKLVGASGLDLFDLPAFAAQVNVPSLALSAFALCALFFIGAKAPKVPGALAVLAFGLMFSVAFDLEAQGVHVLGDMPAGLPSFTLPKITGLGVVVMVGGAFSIAITVAIESLLTLNTFSMREGERPHGDRELVSFALGNAASAFIGCPPCSASLSRTAAAKSAGGRSQLASVFGALAIAAFVLVLAPYLRYLPEPVLSSIVVYVMVQVVDFNAVERYAKNVRIELAVLSFVAVAVIFFGAIFGVAAGVVVSLLTQLYRSRATGKEKLVGFEGGDTDEVTDVPDNMIVVYLRGFLSFTNIDQQLEDVRNQIVDGIDTVIFEISGVTSVDATATETIRRFMSMLAGQGVCVRLVRSLALANDQYTRYELRRIMKRISVYPTVQSAIDDVNRCKRKHLLDIPLDEYYGEMDDEEVQKDEDVQEGQDTAAETEGAESASKVEADRAARSEEPQVKDA